jgi:hypothetical protein
LLPFTIHEDKETSTKRVGQIKSFANQAFLGRQKKRVQWYIHDGRLQDRGCDLIPFTTCGDKRKQTQKSWTNEILAKHFWERKGVQPNIYI